MIYIFGFLALLLVAGGAYLYMNMDAIAKQITEKVSSNALGVPVHVGKMNISLEDKKIVVSNINITNPKGYKKPNAITINKIEVAGESFSKELLVFSRIIVDGTNVNLEVGNKGSNLGDLKNNIGGEKASTAKYPEKKEKPKDSKKISKGKGEDIKVVVKKFSLTSAKLNPSVELLGGDIASVTVPDINLHGIGKKENGILAEEAIAQIMDAVLRKFNSYANSAGFLKGISLNGYAAKNAAKVLEKNLKDNYKKEAEDLKQSLDGLKGIFK